MGTMKVTTQLKRSGLGVAANSLLRKLLRSDHGPSETSMAAASRLPGRSFSNSFYPL